MSVPDTVVSRFKSVVGTFNQLDDVRETPEMIRRQVEHQHRFKRGCNGRCQEKTGRGNGPAQQIACPCCTDPFKAHLRTQFRDHPFLHSWHLMPDSNPKNPQDVEKVRIHRGEANVCQTFSATTMAEEVRQALPSRDDPAAI